MADSDLAELRKQCITSLYLCTENISKYLDSEKDAEFDKLKSYVQAYCTQEAEEDVAIQALEKAKRETDTTNVDTLEERFKAHLGSMAGQRLNVNNHPYMKEFSNKVVKRVQSARKSINEPDFAMTGSQERHIDPITKKPIQNPMRNTVCGHIYEKETIMNYIRTMKKSKCPVSGCGNRGPIRAQNLMSDEELQFRLSINTHSTMIQERSITNLDETQ